MSIRTINVAFAAVAMLILILGWGSGYSFSGVAVDLVGSRPIDGFGQQMAYVENAFREGGLQRLLMTDGLLAVHSLRYVVIWPFVTIERSIGGAGALALLLTMVYPLVRYDLPATLNGFDKMVVIAGRMIPLFLLLLVSGRTSVVAIGAGYVISSVYSRARAWPALLVSGVALISLSSSVELICLAVVVGATLLYPWIRKGQPAQLFAAIALISVLIGPSVLAKFDGFTSARDGYLSPQEAMLAEESFDHVYGDAANLDRPAEGANPEIAPISLIQRMFYRSTIYVSYAYDQKARLFLYLGSALLAFCYLAYCLAVRRVFDMTLPVAVTVFGPLLEGLGFWAMLWPLVWALTGSDRLFSSGFRKSAPKPDKGVLIDVPR